MSVNARIREARNARGYSQKELAVELGVAQTSISFMEKEGNTVPDKNIKTISLLLNLNENWLRTGELPMFLAPETFSLDNFIEEKGGTELEKEIIKTYFELDPEIRKTIIEHFKNKLTLSSNSVSNNLYEGCPQTPDEMERKYPPIDTNRADVG